MHYDRNNHILSGIPNAECAEGIHEYLKIVARACGFATVADLSAKCGIYYSPIDKNSGWTPEMLSRVVCDKFDNELIFPATICINRHKIHDKHEEPISTEPHPIYINVTTSDMDDPDCILCSVLAHAQKIGDRDIFINVY